MLPNAAGQMIEHVWLELPRRFANIKVDISQVKPNHFHYVIIIDAQSEMDLGQFVGTIKSLTTHEYIKGVKLLERKPFDRKLWLLNYYEHIIRNEEDYLRIYAYIQDNPLKWASLYHEPTPWDGEGE